MDWSSRQPQDALAYCFICILLLYLHNFALTGIFYCHKRSIIIKKLAEGLFNFALGRPGDYLDGIEHAENQASTYQDARIAGLARMTLDYLYALPLGHPSASEDAILVVKEELHRSTTALAEIE